MLRRGAILAIAMPASDFLGIPLIFGDLGGDGRATTQPLNPKKWENPEISTRSRSAYIRVNLRFSYARTHLSRSRSQHHSPAN